MTATHPQRQTRREGVSQRYYHADPPAPSDVDADALIVAAQEKRQREMLAASLVGASDSLISDIYGAGRTPQQIADDEAAVRRKRRASVGVQILGDGLGTFEVTQAENSQDLALYNAAHNAAAKLAGKGVTSSGHSHWVLLNGADGVTREGLRDELAARGFENAIVVAADQ